ncbi:MAG: TIGR03016 family PEP-CTERM system-associated outer membrane protein [Steroidobacteraceae bacterium]
MKYRISAGRRVPHEAPSPLVTLGLIAVLGLPGPAGAQTVPYQYSQRGAIGSGLGQMGVPSGGVFQPRIEGAILYSSNTSLAQSGEDQNDAASLELSPGFYASYSSGAGSAAIDYSMIGRAWEDGDSNDLTHRLEANGEWIALPEWFSLRGQASYGDTIIDPRDGLNYGGLGTFGQSNLTEVATATGSPILRHRFKNFEVVAQYSYGRTWYLDEGKGEPVSGFELGRDAIDQSANFSLGTATDARVSGRVFYDWQDSDFENQLPYRFERAGFDGGLQISRTLSLVGDVGKESELQVSTTEGGLDEDFWSAGLKWAPNERTSAEARYGERFFGTSYSVAAIHTARLLEFSASYSEQPTVETRRLSLSDIVPGELPTGIPDIELGLYNRPYVAKSANVGVTAAGSRTTLSLSGFQYDRDFIDEALVTETSMGVRLGATRQLASNLSADLSLSYSDIERAQDFDDPVVSGISSDYDTQALLRLNRNAGAKLTLSGEAGYFIRSGALDYDGWWVGLRAKYEPRARGE